MQTTNGGDTANVRLSLLTPFSAQIFIEEEQSLDDELVHAPEDVGVLVLGAGPLFSDVADDGGFGFLTGPESDNDLEPIEGPSINNNSKSGFRLNNR